MAVDVSVLPLTVFELSDAAYVRPLRWVLESPDCQSMTGNSSSLEASDHKNIGAALLCMSASCPSRGLWLESMKVMHRVTSFTTPSTAQTT